jgi:hypothetical protein
MKEVYMRRESEPLILKKTEAERALDEIADLLGMSEGRRGPSEIVSAVEGVLSNLHHATSDGGQG